MNRPLRILFVVQNLANRSGMVLHVRDLAVELLRRGHSPIVYSPTRGVVADELRDATIAVPDSLDKIAAVPDVIHGHNHVETMVALLHFPTAPAIATCHGWLSWKNAPPPLFPRLLRYVPVDYTCRDRLIHEQGIPESRIEVMFNFVDLTRFGIRSPLPAKPTRAVVFNNEPDFAHFALIREACAAQGITLDVIGGKEQRVIDPSSVIGQYDVVFAKGRSAIEAMAVGTAVIVCGPEGLGTLITTDNYVDLRGLNFGKRSLHCPVTPEMVAQQLDRYDAHDAAQVAQRIRSEAGLDVAVDKLIALYETVIEEHARATHDRVDEERMAAAYFEGVGGYYRTLVRRAKRVLRLRLSAQRAEHAEQIALAQARLAAHKATHERLKASNEKLAAEIRTTDAEARKRYDVLRADRNTLRETREQERAELKRLRAELSRAEDARDHARARLDAIEGSPLFRLWQRLSGVVRFGSNPKQRLLPRP